MENDQEAFRLDIKTDVKVVERQARWAGIKPGMHVADICYGSGKTTSILHKLVQPYGTVVGVDGSQKRVSYAQRHYGVQGIVFECRNVLDPLNDLGTFDFVWVRFLLEYFRMNSRHIIENISSIVKPGGILCLIDLDHNGLNHFGMSQRLEKALFSAMKKLEETANFDPYVGRKLYSFLYDLGYQNIKVNVMAHHLIFGKLKDADAYNWMKKIEVVAKKLNYDFEDYKGRHEEFNAEFKKFFTDPRRFTYTPAILCRGSKPLK